MVKLSWKHVLVASVAAVSLIGAPALAQVEVNQWDQNADKALDENEFNTGFGEAGVFGDWDADDDNMLSEDEFNQGIGDNTAAFNERFGEGAFGEWDENDDDLLAEEEFNEGVYGAYDEDGDGVIEEPELGDLGDDMGDGGFWDV